MAVKDSLAVDDTSTVYLSEISVLASRVPIVWHKQARMVTTINSKAVQSTPSQSINDVLKYSASVDVRQRGPIGAQTDVGIRGGSSEQSAVLLNGINISDPQTSHNSFDLPLTMEFMAVSSYGSATKTSGVVRVLKDLDNDVLGRDVIIVEDIVDSGVTLNYLKGMLQHRGAASICIVTLLDKPERRRVKDLKVDYSCFNIPDEFVVGYGLDYDQAYRNLPDIGVLSPKVYEKR